MDKLVITAWTGMTVRNVIWSPLYQELEKHFDLTVYSNFSTQLKRIATTDNLHVDFSALPIPRWWLSTIQSYLTKLLFRWNYYALWLSRHPETAGNYMELEESRNLFLFHLTRLGGKYVNYLRRHVNRDRDWLRDLAYTLPLKAVAGHTDVLFVTTTDISQDQMLMYSFKKLGVPVVALVHSWDNLPSRGLLSSMPNRLLVWNKFMAEDAHQLHDISRSSIEIVGVPQYELYRRIDMTVVKDPLLSTLQIPKSTRIITYTGNAEYVFPDEPEFVETLLQIISEGRFGRAVLIFRLHPTERHQFYRSKYAQSPLPIRLDFPDENFAAESTKDIGKLNTIDHFVRLMKYSDVVINVASTITLDSLLFGTPVICPIFNLSLSPTAWNAAGRWYQSTHFRRLLVYDAIRLPDTMTSLVTSIDDALLYPDEKLENTRQLIDDFAPNLPTSKLICDGLLRECPQY